jgi:hypothetical protein
MPLDGIEFLDNPTLEKLEQLQLLLATEDQWCKGALRDRKGRHCLVGAIALADGRRELTKPILQAARELSGRHYWRIQSFNDDPATTHADVLRVIARARLAILDDIARAGRPDWSQKLKNAVAKLIPPVALDSAQLDDWPANDQPGAVMIRADVNSRREEVCLPDELYR